MDSTANLCLKALVSKLGGSVVLPLKDIQREDNMHIGTLSSQNPPSVKVTVHRTGDPLQLLHVPEQVISMLMANMVLQDLVRPAKDPVVAKFITDFAVFIRDADCETVGKFGLATEVYLEKRT